MRTRVISAIGLLAALSAASFGQPRIGATIEPVLKDWKSRHDRLQSVRYKLVGTAESFGGPLMKGYPAPIPGPRPLRAVVLIDLVNKRYRLDEDKGYPSKVHDRYLRRVTTTTYDGKASHFAVPRENEERSAETPDISIAKGDLTMSRVDAYLEPVFMAHGLIPTEDTPLGPGRFPASHEADDFEIKGAVMHSGRPCLMLRTGPANTTPAVSDEYWIDSQRQSAVVRLIHWSGKEPILRTDIDHQQTPHGWLPVKWAFVTTIDGEVRNITKLNVEVVEANPALQVEDFTLPVKPGMSIEIFEYPGRGKGLDPARPARTFLKVETDGNMSEVRKEGFRTAKGVQLPPDSGSKRWWWIGGIAVATFSVVLCFWVWRRRKRPEVSSPVVNPH